jgi:hypothetical protein
MLNQVSQPSAGSEINKRENDTNGIDERNKNIFFFYLECSEEIFPYLHPYLLR